MLQVWVVVLVVGIVGETFDVKMGTVGLYGTGFWRMLMVEAADHHELREWSTTCS
jgi:hypothetical protein